MRVDESSLTGESVASLKPAATTLPGDSPLGERSNMAFMNAVVAAGHGERLMTATGMATEMGRVAGMLHATEVSVTPLRRRLDQLGWRLATFGLALIAVIFTLDLVRGEPVSDAVAFAIALAVASIPEGLPTVVTVTLALGAHRMAKRGAILRRLAAVETLGSTTVICSDKTGTLTLNQMTARAIACGGEKLLVTGDGYPGDGVSAPFAPGVFETTNLSLAQWALAAAIGASVLVLAEADKHVAAAWKRHARQPQGAPA